MIITEAADREMTRTMAAFARQIRGVLNGGFRFADQARVVSFRFSTQAPVLVQTLLRRPPAGLICLSMAETRGDRARVVSGAAITWRGSADGIVIETIAGAIPGVDYDVSAAVLEG
jgi:hypothetical protein